MTPTRRDVLRAGITGLLASRWSKADASQDRPALAPAVILLDDCDPNYKGDDPHHDGIRVYSAEGKEIWAIRTLNNCQSIGANHGVVIDAKRKRIYFRELVADRITALDLKGNVIYRIDNLHASALAVHPSTGHLWCTGTAASVVLDLEGEKVGTIPCKGFDIAYDPGTDSFWFVDLKELQRVDATDKKALLRNPIQAAWAFVSIAPAPFAGGVWVVERAHPQVAPSVDQLIFVSNEGKLVKQFSRDGWRPFGVACDQKTGTAWVVDYRKGLFRVPLEGDDIGHWKMAAASVAVGPDSGDLWVATVDELIRFDSKGKELRRIRIGKESAQSWLAAF